MKYIGSFVFPLIKYSWEPPLKIRVVVYDTCWDYIDSKTEDAFFKIMRGVHTL